jgi:serine/threonine-protein kinase RsbW
MRVLVTLTLPRDAVSVPLARHTVSAALQRAGVTADCRAEVEVAVSEACTNALHHSGDGGSYDVRVQLGDERLEIEVIDAGAGFGPGPVVGVMSHPAAENGRGMALMAAYSDSAVFDTVADGGGVVQLTKQLRWADGAPLPQSSGSLAKLRA